MSKAFYTIGHSTRSIEYFIDLLKAYDINMLIDIRTIPHSEHNPQFNEESLKAALKEEHIRYRHLVKLGGFRHTTKASINTGWQNLSFRGFADYMQTPPFWKGIEELEKLGGKYKCAIMCAEAVPWRCHRSLIADVLVLHNWSVFHIQSKITAKPHELTPFLHVNKEQLIYSAITKPRAKK